MTTPLIILILIIGVPVVALMALRINAALVFLSLCLGNVLNQFVADDTGSFMSAFSSHASKVTTSQNNVKIALLLLPVILTALFMIKTVKGSRLVLNVLPAAGVGLLGALLVVPLLPAGTAANVTASPLWHQVTSLQDLIVGMSALLCLLVLWLQRPKSGGDEKHGKHGH